MSSARSSFFFAILIGPIHPVPTSKVIVALLETSKYKCNTHNERAQVRIQKKPKNFTVITREMFAKPFLIRSESRCHLLSPLHRRRRRPILH